MQYLMQNRKKNKSSHTSKFLVKVAAIAALTFYFVYLVSCNAIQTKKSQWRGHKLMVSYPLVNDTGFLTDLRDTLLIFYLKNNVVYHIPYFNSTTINGKLISEEVKHHYFIFQKTDKYGYFYDQINDSSIGKKLQVDSFLFNNAFAIKINNDSLVLLESLMDKKNNELLEKYRPNKWYNEFTYDSTYFYYSGNLKKIDYFFSQPLDSIKNMKLYKIRFLYNAYHSNTANINVPKREFLFKVEPLQINMDLENNSLVKKIKADIIRSKKQEKNQFH
jgi:hypothetical protein